MSAITRPASASSIDQWKSFAGARVPGPLGRVLCLEDFEPLARGRLPRAIFGYVSSAAETGASFQSNRLAFADWAFVPRVLRNVADRSQTKTLFGREWASPFGIAPMGLGALSAYDGDRVLARAAAAAGIPFALSGTSLTRLEEVVAAAPGSWFQAYLPGDTARIDALVRRVQRAGVRTLLLTVDIPVAGNRENNVRAGFSTPLRPSAQLAWDGLSHPRWLFGTLARTLVQRGMPHFENSFAERGAPVISRTLERDFSQREHLDLSHAARIRAAWSGELVIKGVLHHDDVAAARQLGADGVILSNHGGRQLDGAVSALRMLPRALEAAGAMPVMIDGGFRRGSDVLKALALGAAFVFVGRPMNHAATVAGQAGVARAIELLREEIDRNLAMLGVTSLDALGPEFLYDLRAGPLAAHLKPRQET